MVVVTSLCPKSSCGARRRHGRDEGGGRVGTGRAIADEPDRVRESRAEHEYEPTPCRLLHGCPGEVHWEGA
jgi:hypothetical protein